jgi:nuclease-like protein
MSTPTHAQEPRRYRLRYAGFCFWCGKSLAKGQEVFYDPVIESVRCIVCEDARPEDAGTPGGSAQQEYDRRRSADARVKASLDNIMVGVANASTREPQSTRAWAQGATGERRLAAVLQDIPGLRILSDRRVPYGRANLDFVVVSRSGVFVIDAKLHRGVITFRDEGDASTSDIRLYVNGRDRSSLADSMQWQLDVVEQALEASIDPTPWVTPVICFVDGKWPIPLPPVEFRRVLLVSERSIRSLVAEERILGPRLVDRIYHTLAAAFPSK